MKNALLIPVVCVSSLVACVAVVSFFVTLAMFDVSALSLAGNSGRFLAAFIDRSLYVVPLGAIFATLMVFLFLIRHPSFVPLSLLFVCVSLAAVWAFIIPGAYRAQDRVALAFGTELSDSLSPGKGLLPSGSIRPAGEGVRSLWLSTSVDGSSAGPVIIINAQAKDTALTVYPSLAYDSETRALKRKSATIVPGAGGADALVTAHVNRPRFLSAAVSQSTIYLSSLRSAVAGPYLSYLVIAGGYALALMGLWYCSICTGWRLLNVFLAIGYIRGFLWMNAWFPSSGAFSVIRRLLSDAVPSSLIPPLWCGAFGAIALIAGSMTAISRRAARRRGGSYA